MRDVRQIRILFRSLAALLLGLLLACGMFLGLALLIANDAQPPKQADRIAQAKARQIAQKAKQKAPKHKTKVSFRPQLAKKVEPPKPIDKLTGQVVDTARPTVEKAPEKANYLGRYDSSVKREVKSKGRKTPGRDLGKAAIANPSSVQSLQSNSKDPTRIPERKQVQQAREGKPKENADSMRPNGGPGAAPLAKAGDRARQGSPVVRGSHDGLLLPATSPGNVMHNIQMLAGNPGSNDHLPDVDDEGDVNILNTRKFRYADFFQRVKDKVSSEWEPGRIWTSRDPTGNRYGVRDRLTILRVTLDTDGMLKRVLVARRSGLEFLDEEAQRAFAAAGPYPNPPVGLRNERGEIEFQFGFMFEISTRQFKLQRLPE